MSNVAPPEPPVALADQVRNLGLKEVAIVDDSYDPPANVEPLEEEQTQLWALFQRDESTRTSFASLSNTLQGSDEISYAWTMEVLSAQPQNLAIKQLIEESDYGKHLLGRRPDMEAIEQGLKTELKLEVRTFGSQPDLDGLVGVQVVFLDWYLGQDSDEQSINAAVLQAERIYNHFPADAKPIIVLISWFPAMVSRSAEFREKSGLISGIFHCLEKNELRQPELRALHLLNLAESIELGHIVQRFSESVILHSNDSLRAFHDAVKGLSLSDYSTIQVMSLQEDGHPLGDYMCWMLSGLLADIVFGDTVMLERQALNASDFQAVNVPIDKPSQTLARIYHSAVFDMGVGAVENHPHAPDGGLSHPNLGLGDLFLVKERPPLAPTLETPLAPRENKLFGYFLVVLEWLGLMKRNLKNETPESGIAALGSEEKVATSGVGVGASSPMLYLLLNPECDLAQRPRPIGEKKPRLAKASSLLLVPGVVGSLPAPRVSLPDGVHRTPLFVHGGFNDGKGVYIDWMLKAVMTVPFAGFEDWASGDQTHVIERVGRMRPLHALEIQHRFTAEMSRVGVPVAPPYYLDAPVRLQFTETRTVAREESVSNQMRLVPLTGSPSQPASISYAGFTQSLITAVMNEMIRRRDAANGNSQPSRIELEQAIANHQEWMTFRQPRILKDLKEINLFNSIVVLDPSGDGTRAVTSNKTIIRIVFDAKEESEHELA